MAADGVPTLTRDLPGRRRLAAAGVWLISQLAVSYRRSPLSVECVSRRGSRLRAGERVADQIVTKGGHTMRLHDLLAKPGVHVLLDRDAAGPGRDRRHCRERRRASACLGGYLGRSQIILLLELPMRLDAREGIVG